MVKSKEKKQPIGVGVYDIERFLPGRWGSSNPRDPLDEVLELQAKDLARRAKTVSVESFIAQKEADINKIKGLSPGGSSEERVALIRALFNEPQVQADWLALDDASRITILTTINSLSEQGQSQSTLATYLPFLMARQRQNPQTSLKDMVELFKIVSGGKGQGDNNKNILEAIRLGFDLSKKNNPGASSTSIFKETMQFLQPLYATLSHKDKELYGQQFAWLRGQVQPLSEQLKSASEVAGLMGFSKGGNTLEIERMRINHERWMAEQGWKREEWRDSQKLKEMSENKRWNAITAIGTKWMDKAAPIIDAGINAAQKHILANASNPGLAMLSCVSCGTSISISGEPDVVNCPSCGLAHKKN